MPDRQPHGTLGHTTDASSAYPGPLAWACCLTGCLKLESQAPRIGLCVPRRLSPTPAGPYSTVTPSPLLFHMIKLSVSGVPSRMLWSCDVEDSGAKGAGGDCGDPGGAARLRASSGFGDHLVMWDESCQGFRFFQRSRELPDQCSQRTPRRLSLRTVSCRSTPRPGGAWRLRKGPSWLQVGWEVRPAVGPRASQQTCLGMGQLSPVWLQKQQPWQALQDPLGPSEAMVPVLELFGAKQTDRQKQVLPTVD